MTAGSVALVHDNGGVALMRDSRGEALVHDNRGCSTGSGLY